MGDDYASRLSEMRSESGMSYRVRRGKALLAEYGAWLRRYRGGLPAGTFAAIMQMESDGKMAAPGDESLGEVGFFQITRTFPAKLGLPAESRYQPEVNVFLGGAEYQLEAAKAAKLWPQLVQKGSEDQWKLARLAFSIGAGGTRDLVSKAIVAVPHGPIYQRVKTFVDATGGIAYGSQSAAKVRYRVHVVDVIFDVGRRVEGGSFGPPQVIPAPASIGRYTFPPELLPFTGKPGLGIIGVAGLAAGAFLLARYA